MRRITITIDDDLLELVDELARHRGYASRSEAFRDLVRDHLDRRDSGDPNAKCVAALSYVYDHATRDLAGRLTHAHHDHHDLSIASLHVHLDHELCLEISVLQGAASAVTGFADALATQRGVRHAQLHVIPALVSSNTHTHGGRSVRHGHVHA